MQPTQMLTDAHLTRRTLPPRSPTIQSLLVWPKELRSNLKSIFKISCSQLSQILATGLTWRDQSMLIPRTCPTSKLLIPTVLSAHTHSIRFLKVSQTTRNISKCINISRMRTWTLRIEVCSKIVRLCSTRKWVTSNSNHSNSKFHKKGALISCNKINLINNNIKISECEE